MWILDIYARKPLVSGCSLDRALSLKRTRPCCLLQSKSSYQPFPLCPPWKRTKFGAQSEPSSDMFIVPYRGGRRLLCGHNRSSLGRSYIYHCQLTWRMYQMAGADAILADRVRAHDTRAVSSLWALLFGASLKEIQQAAFWSIPNFFISCYLKDVLVGEASFAAAVLRSSGVGSSGSGPAKGIP